jgi:hypothetical protein
VPSTVRTIAELPANGVSRVTPSPMQMNLISRSRTMTSLQGSSAVPAPLYL